jgi:hypothetical protein
MSLRLLILIYLSVNCISHLNCDLGMSHHYTQWDSHGGGDIHYLDRFQLICPGKSVMSYWACERSGGSWRFRYGCLTGGAILDQAEWRYTNFNGVAWDVRRSIHFLDRHHVNCLYDEAISAFYVQRSGTYIRYAYKCVKVKFTGSIQNRRTSYSDSDRGEIFELSDQVIEGPNYNFQALNGFKLSYQIYWDWGDKFKICYDVWYMSLRYMDDANLNNMN